MSERIQTDYDAKISNDTFELIKSIIPYINNGNTIGIIIKFFELRNALSIKNTISNEDNAFDKISEALSNNSQFSELFELLSMMEMLKDSEGGMFDGYECEDEDS